MPDTPVIVESFNELEVADYGSDYFYWRFVDGTTGAITGTLTNSGWVAGPIRESFEIPDGSSTNTKTSEGGKERTTSTKKKFDLKLILQQVSPLILKSIPDSMEGKIVQFLLEMNEDPIDGENHYLTCLGKMTKRPTPKSKVSPEFEFSLLQATAAITIAVDATKFPNLACSKADPVRTGNVTQAIGDYFGMASI